MVSTDMSRCRRATESSPPPSVQPLRPLLAAEPFRVFFPWAVSLGLAGVLLWPLFLGHYLQFHPALLHARLMIFGFGGGCIIGFLGTAAPRMLGTPALRGWETVLLALLHAASILACAMLRDGLGCILFAGTLAALLFLLARRFAARTDMPPPGFIMVLLGLLSGLTGALMFAFNLDWQNPFNFRFSRLLMNEAFLLLPVLGVSGFLVTRILGLPSRQSFPDSRTPPAGWWPLALEALVTGVLLMVSFVLEATGRIQLGAGLRFCLIMGWWVRDMPGLWTAKTVGTQAWMLKMGLGSVAVAPLCLALDPMRLIAMEHVLFITGFGLTMLAVASRVVYGHSGQLEQARQVSKPLRWITWLAILAMSTRVSADYMVSIQNSHYIYAAYTWAIITVIWLRLVWSKLWTPDPS